MGLIKEDRLRAKQLSERSDGPGLRQLGSHLAVIGLGIGLVSLADGWLTVIAAQILLGIGLTFLFAPAHESVHRTAFKSRWLNTVTGNLAGLVLILPPIYFRHFHLAHHRHTQIPGKDPELAGKAIETRLGFVWHVTGIPYWQRMTLGLIQRALGHSNEDFIDDGNRAAITREARLYLLVYVAGFAASLLTGSTVLLVYWVVPMLLTQPFLRLYLLAEHKLCTLDDDPFSNTRTMMTNPVVRFLTWNMTYHTEHHAFMAVPFHGLPDMHAHLCDRLKMMTPGYAAFYRDYLKSLS